MAHVRGTPRELAQRDEGGGEALRGRFVERAPGRPATRGLGELVREAAASRPERSADTVTTNGPSSWPLTRFPWRGSAVTSPYGRRHTTSAREPSMTNGSTDGMRTVSKSGSPDPRAGVDGPSSAWTTVAASASVGAAK